MASSRKWHASIFGCCSDPSGCCLTCCCPCVAHGMLYHAIHGTGEWEPCGCYYLTLPCCIPPCIRGSQLRRDLRGKYGLMASPCGDRYSDYCYHFFCHTCATCQEIREIKWRKGPGRETATSAEVHLYPEPQQPSSSIFGDVTAGAPECELGTPSNDGALQPGPASPPQRPEAPQQTIDSCQAPHEPASDYGYGSHGYPQLPPPPHQLAMQYENASDSAPPAPSAPPLPPASDAAFPDPSPPMGPTPGYLPARSAPGNSQYPLM